MNKIMLETMKSVISSEGSLKTTSSRASQGNSQAASGNAEGLWSSVPVRMAELRSTFTAHSAKAISV